MGLVIYILAWLAFATLHSMLARQSIQENLETYLGSYYRFTYNIVAAIKILIVLYVGSVFLSTDRFPWLESKTAVIATWGIHLAGYIVLALALIAYDLGRFSGVTQIVKGERVSSSTTNEPLQRRFLSKWVRHPLYTGAFLCLWGGATSNFGLWTAILGSLYLVIGTSFEERKLRNIYGEEYRLYQNEVPKYFPSLKFLRTTR